MSDKKMILVNGVECPVPEAVSPESGTQYYFIELDSIKNGESYFYDCLAVTHTDIWALQSENDSAAEATDNLPMPCEDWRKSLIMRGDKDEQPDPFECAPDWARFRATDEGGEIWFFESQPHDSNNSWIRIGGSRVQCKYVANWRESLIERKP